MSEQNNFQEVPRSNTTERSLSWVDRSTLASAGLNIVASTWYAEAGDTRHAIVAGLLAGALTGGVLLRRANEKRGIQ